MSVQKEQMRAVAYGVQSDWHRSTVRRIQCDMGLPDRKKPKVDGPLRTQSPRAVLRHKSVGRKPERANVM